jgi:biofilm protein TabA
MLLFPLAEAARFHGLHPLFPVALAWLAEAKNRDAPAGRHSIRGDDLFVIAENGMTHDAVQRRFESHRRYVDIQVSLAGGETIEWTPTAGLQVQDDFQGDGDIAFYAHPERLVTRLALLPDYAAIFYPEDAHKPVLHLAGKPSPYRKLVFKVAVMPG